MQPNLRPYEHDDRILINMSVWRSVEALKKLMYRSAHAELLKHGTTGSKCWGVYMALWRVPAGHLPGIDEARKRLAHLEEYGPSEFAFTFKQIFQPHEEFQNTIDWSSFLLCPAADSLKIASDRGSHRSPAKILGELQLT